MRGDMTEQTNEALDAELSVDDRLSRLEDVMLHDEALLSAVVDGLRGDTRGLTTAILRAEQTQRIVFGLKRRMDDISQEQTNMPTKEDFEAEVERLTRERAQDRTRMKSVFYTSIVVLLLFVGALVLAFFGWVDINNAASEDATRAVVSVCNQRNQQSDVIHQFFQNQIKRVERDPELTEQAKFDAIKGYNELLRAFPTVDCQALNQ